VCNQEAAQRFVARLICPYVIVATGNAIPFSPMRIKDERQSAQR